MGTTVRLWCTETFMPKPRRRSAGSGSSPSSPSSSSAEPQASTSRSSSSGPLVAIEIGALALTFAVSRSLITVCCVLGVFRAAALIVTLRWASLLAVAAFAIAFAAAPGAPVPNFRGWPRDLAAGNASTAESLCDELQGVPDVATFLAAAGLRAESPSPRPLILRGAASSWQAAEWAQGSVEELVARLGPEEHVKVGRKRCEAGR